MIITFSGQNGSGKTLASKTVAERLGYEWWGMGEVKRALARDMGLTIREFDERSRKDPERFHRAFDERTVKLGEKDCLVVDARAGWHFIPHSKKVFLTASKKVRAERVLLAGRDSEHAYASADEALSATDERAETFRHVMLELYGVDVYDPANFDIVIDTSDLSPGEVVEAVLSALDK